MNAILIVQIVGLDLGQILEAYTKNLKYLVSKGFKPKVNAMGNRATNLCQQSNFCLKTFFC